MQEKNTNVFSSLVCYFVFQNQLFRKKMGKYRKILLEQNKSENWNMWLQKFI